MPKYSWCFISNLCLDNLPPLLSLTCETISLLVQPLLTLSLWCSSKLYLPNLTSKEHKKNTFFLKSSVVGQIPFEGSYKPHMKTFQASQANKLRFFSYNLSLYFLLYLDLKSRIYK